LTSTPFTGVRIEVFIRPGYTIMVDVGVGACVGGDAMSTSLSPENEQFLERVVSLGLYQDRSEALDRAVELLRHREQLIRDVNEGIEQLERGQGVPLDIDAIKAAVHTRLETP
jgi:antitoxin ParD1/3/4